MTSHIPLTKTIKSKVLKITGEWGKEPMHNHGVFDGCILLQCPCGDLHLLKGRFFSGENKRYCQYCENGYAWILSALRAVDDLDIDKYASELYDEIDAKREAAK